MESVGIVINVIQQNMRTEELLSQSQGLTEELQERSEELQSQQEELKRSKSELEMQAASLKASEELLQQQSGGAAADERGARGEGPAARGAEQPHRDQEPGDRGGAAALEDKAEQLALSSKYKSEFLANMSHELRTPLNSLLILAKLLSENPDGNLTDKQIEFSRTIHTAGSDLLELINDILDLSKVEAGKMDIDITEVKLGDVRDFVDRTFRPSARRRNLEFTTEIHGANVPPTIVTDEHALQQVLKNPLSNACKFTDAARSRCACRSPATARGS